jgi:hypothetical protein
VAYSVFSAFDITNAYLMFASDNWCFARTDFSVLRALASLNWRKSLTGALVQGPVLGVLAAIRLVAKKRIEPDA